MKRILERNVVSIMQVPLSVSDFQKNAAMGLMVNPENVNNGATGNAAVAWFVNDTAEIDLGTPMVFSQFRQYGNGNNWGTGEWRLRYWDAWKQGWVNWGNLFYTRAGFSWGSWTSGEIVESFVIQLIAITLDGKNGRNYINQLEMKL